MGEHKSGVDQAIVLRPGDEKAEVSMGFVCHGSIADFQRIRSFIENETKVRLVRGTMGQSKLWLVKNHEYQLLKGITPLRSPRVKSAIQDVESRGGEKPR